MSLIYPRAYSKDEYPILFSAIENCFITQRFITFELNGRVWTLRFHTPNGWIKKNKFILKSGDSVRHFRRLSQVFNYLRNELGIIVEEDNIDDEIRRLLHQVI